jgi:hypothetical protein
MVVGFTTTYAITTDATIGTGNSAPNKFALDFY